jgi:hypothetical protein
MTQMTKRVPTELVEHILPFNWDVRRVWEQEAAISRRPLADFEYLLDLPLWSSQPKQGLLFDVAPRVVMDFPEKSPHQTQRLHEARIEFPIDLLHHQGREWVLDGVHRIAKLSLMGVDTVSVRVHDETAIPRIIVQAEAAASNHSAAPDLKSESSVRGSED